MVTKGKQESDRVKQAAESAPAKPVLVYDGNCPICRKTMDWIGRNSEHGTFEMLTCQSEAVQERFPMINPSDCMQAMHLILTDGRILAGEKAMPEIFKRMPKYRSAAHVFDLPGAKTFSRNVYRWFADHRYSIAKILFPRKEP